MTKNFGISAVRGLAALGLALCMLTLIPAVSVSFTSAPAPVQGGYSVIYKNGETPRWMAQAIEREIGGVWI